ncbi:hypothetical protein L1987_06188 [Smallanthus sonchifolius]|uniref:Uncharacterized protein n=1 Tax=Smallanthus sonchifolius TaxID=185202 RepID=A0ACB9JXN3_9ASTR|nr:hypothetical protein L1987_06188 [Smallanthus sonchifolius]
MNQKTTIKDGSDEGAAIEDSFKICIPFNRFGTHKAFHHSTNQKSPKSINQIGKLLCRHLVSPASSPRRLRRNPSQGRQKIVDDGFVPVNVAANRTRLNIVSVVTDHRCRQSRSRRGLLEVASSLRLYSLSSRSLSLSLSMDLKDDTTAVAA